MNKRVILCVFIALAVIFSGFADAPQYGTTDTNLISHMNDLNETISEVFDGIQGMLDGYLPNNNQQLNSLLTGFGKSAIFASHGATMFGYSEYKSISISIGTMVGLQLPAGSGQAISSNLLSGNFAEIGNALISKLPGDFDLGVNPQAINAHIGFNPSAFFKGMPKSLSFGLQLGYFGFPGGFDIDIGGQTANVNFTNFTIGATVNFQLIPTVSLGGLLKWRGINIGSGFIYQSTKLDLATSFEQAISNSTGQSEFDNLKAKLTPTLNLNVNTFTIPVEVSTAVTLLIFNIPIGVGFDIGFGTSEIASKAGVSVTGLPSSIYETQAGSLDILNGNVDINVFNFKIMTGFGITFGDYFIIDIPITYYFDDGFNVGVTLAVRF